MKPDVLLPSASQVPCGRIHVSSRGGVGELPVGLFFCCNSDGKNTFIIVQIKAKATFFVVQFVQVYIEICAL